jgi:Sporulation and spore germination
MIPRNLVISAVVMVLVALGMGIYAWRMRRHEFELQPVASDRRPVAPPAVGPTEQVTLYVAYDDPGVLRAQSARIPLPSGRQQRAEELLRALVNTYLGKSSTHPLAPGSEIRDVYLVEPGMAVIDTNAAFADGHRSGILVEELTLLSLVQSLAANIGGINRVKILVDGKERETLAGHADLSDFFDVGAMSRVVEQMEGAGGRGI